MVGGGPTGVEFSGELNDFIREEVSRLYPRLRNRASVVLLNSAGSLLSAFDAELQQRALTTLRREGTDIRLRTRVSAVEAERIAYSDADGAKYTLPYGLCVWAAGNTFRQITLDFARTLGSEQESSVSRGGRLQVDGFLRVKGGPKGVLPDMFAMGDVAGIIDRPLPQTAQVAAQQGAYLARLINRGYDLGASVPTLPTELWSDTLWMRARGQLAAKSFHFLNLGLLAYVGDSEAVAQVQLGNATLLDAVGGRAFLLWRSVYVVKQVSLRTRLLVLFDFAKTKLFGRDLTAL